MLLGVALRFPPTTIGVGVVLGLLADAGLVLAVGDGVVGRGLSVGVSEAGEAVACGVEVLTVLAAGIATESNVIAPELHT